MRRTLLLVAAGLVVLVGAAAAIGIAFYSRASKSVTAEITAFTNAPPYTVTFQVDKPPSDTVACDLAAIDFQDNEVGAVNGIVVGPAAGRSTRLSVVVPTRATPTQFQVVQCLVRK